MATKNLEKQLSTLESNLNFQTIPHSLEVEKQIIGGMLLDIEAASLALEKLESEDFFLDKHKILFNTIYEMNKKDTPVDILTLSNSLKKSGDYQKSGGEDYLMDISAEIVSWANIGTHCDIVKEKSIQRKLIKSCNSILEECRKSSLEIDDLLDLAESHIYKIGETNISHTYLPISRVLKDTFALIEKYSSTEIMGVPSGFADLDVMTGGWQKTDLIILAGRPSMGKTSLALNFLTNAALRAEKSVVIFSLEMSKEQLVQRILCSEARISLQRLRTGKLPKRDYPKLLDIAGELNNTKIYIDDNANQSAMQIRSICRRIAKQSGGLDMVVIDYLQLMSGSGENRQQEISQISRSLKGLAKELQAPVIALSQLNRSVESRQEGRPMLSDLRESGALEQDADLVTFIYREEIYKQQDPGLQGKAEVIVAKQRNGPVGSVPLSFLKECTAFTNYSPRNPENEGF